MAKKTKTIEVSDHVPYGGLSEKEKTTRKRLRRNLKTQRQLFYLYHWSLWWWSIVDI